MSSALGQIVNFFYTLQGEAAGAQAFSNFDTLLALFIRYGNMDYAAVKQALQEFVFNVNVPTRVGFQSPFTNLTLDLQPPVGLAGEKVIIGGKYQPETYAKFQHEMNIFNQAFMEVMVEGDSRGRVFTFPIPTYNITPDFDWQNPELEKLWQVTGKYGNPYFANFINSDMSPDDARSMCCRLRLDTRALEKKGGGLFGSAPLTDSIGVVTINLSRLGHLADNEPDFFSRLDRLMDIARASLDTKRKVIERFTEQNLCPYSSFYLRHMKQRNGSRPEQIRSALKKNLLDFVAMDIKAPWHKYHLLCGTPAPLDSIRQSVEMIMDSGIAHEFRTTWVKSLLGESDLEQIRQQLPVGAVHKIQAFQPQKALDPTL